MAITLNEIQAVGLTDAQSRVYFYLMNQGEKTQAQIAAAMQVGVNRISVILKEMTSNNLIGSKKVQKTSYYYIGDFAYLTDYVARTYQTRIKEQQLKAQDQLEKTQALVKELEDTYTNRAYTVSYINSEADLETFRKKHFLSSKPLEVYNINNLDLYKLSDAKTKTSQAKVNNIDIKSIVVSSDVEKFKDKKDWKIFSSSEMKDIKSNIYVFNDTIFTTEIENNQKRLGLVIKNEAFAKSLLTIFKYLYNKK